MKKILILIAVVLSMTACLDNSVQLDGIESSPNLVGFNKASKTVGFLTDDLEHQTNVLVTIVGPSYDSVQGDVVAQISVDPSSTAVDGVNYRLESNSVVLNYANNFSALLPITVITENMSAPSRVSLVLNIDTISNDSLVINGRTKQIRVYIDYLCFSNLDNGNEYLNPDVPNGATTIEEIAPGKYEVGAMPFLSSGGNPIPFEFTDTCGEISIDYLVFGAYLMLGQGTVNNDGSITITYILYNADTVDSGVFFDYSTQPSTYTPQP